MPARLNRYYILWLDRLMQQSLLVRVALANKMARIVWALLARGEVYRAPAAAA